MSDLVENPEEQFSCIVTLLMSMYVSVILLLFLHDDCSAAKRDISGRTAVYERTKKFLCPQLQRS